MKVIDMIDEMNKEIYIRINIKIEIEILIQKDKEIIIETKINTLKEVEILIGIKIKIMIEIEAMEIHEIKVIEDIRENMQTMIGLIKDMTDILINEIMNEIIQEDMINNHIDRIDNMMTLNMNDIISNTMMTNNKTLIETTLINTIANRIHMITKKEIMNPKTTITISFSIMTKTKNNQQTALKNPTSPYHLIQTILSPTNIAEIENKSFILQNHPQQELSSIEETMSLFIKVN